jgi:hypothetical protein
MRSLADLFETHRLEKDELELAMEMGLVEQDAYEDGVKEGKIQQLRMEREALNHPDPFVKEELLEIALL